VPHLLRHGTSIFKVISERPVIFTSECHALGEGAITTYFKHLRFDAAGLSGAQTHDTQMLSESTTTRLLQPGGIKYVCGGHTSLVAVDQLKRDLEDLP
jgi:hypothetical protein